jgi:hypothetical protein
VHGVVLEAKKGDTVSRRRSHRVGHVDDPQDLLRRVRTQRGPRGINRDASTKLGLPGSERVLDKER